MSKPKVTKKQLVAFRELRDKLKNYGEKPYMDGVDKCPLCIANNFNDVYSCEKCICFLFSTEKEREESRAYKDSRGYNSPPSFKICWLSFLQSTNIRDVRAAYQKLKRRMQRAGIKVLT